MNKSKISSIDWGLLAPVLVLVILSLTTLFTVSTSIFTTQLIFTFISIVAFFVISNINIRVLQKYSFGIYIFSVLVFLTVLILGAESRGAVRWIEFAGFRIQFSEIFKPFLALALATFLAKSEKNLKTFLISFALLFPVGLFIFLQPDLGNTLIYAGVLLFTLFFYGFPFLWFGLLVGIFILSIPLFWQFLREYQKERILTFINPASDPLGTSYNAVQSIVAVGSGMFLGKGLGLGTQSMLRFLPERHTDFLFATLSENLGFVGSIVVLVAFAALFKRIYSIIVGAEEKSFKIFGIVAFLLLLIQVFINIGMNIGIVPVVGVTLPFMSYGGSSLLSTFILLGMLACVAKKTKTRQTLEIR